MTFSRVATALVLLVVASLEQARPQENRNAQRGPAAVSKAVVQIAKRDSAHDLYTVGLAAGDPQETEFAMAFDIATAVAAGQESGPRGEGFRVRPVATNGGIDNVRDLLSIHGVDLAIVPANLLDSLKESGRLKGMGRVSYVTRLHSQELHVLAAPRWEKVEDLAGKTVNFGLPDSGTEEIARKLFARRGIKVEIANLPLDRALEGLLTGEIAAAVVLTGRPALALQRLSRVSGFRLLPVEHTPELGRRVHPASFTADDYPNLIAPEERIPTVAVETALVAYDWPRGTRRGEVLKAVIDMFLPKIPVLAERAPHLKWREVSLAAPLDGWKRLEAAHRWVAKAEPETTGSIRPMSREERERLFDEFKTWRQRGGSRDQARAR